MTRVTLIHVGDFRESYLREAQREYEKRLSAFCDFRCVGVKEEDAGSSPAEIEKALRKEGEQITALLPRRAYVYALCVEGQPCSSEAFAASLERVISEGGEPVFVIGSSHGLSEAAVLFPDDAAAPADARCAHRADLPRDDHYPSPRVSQMTAYPSPSTLFLSSR